MSNISNARDAIVAARDKIRAKLVELGLAGANDKLSALATAIDGMENRGAVSISAVKGETIVIPRGYHNGNGTISPPLHEYKWQKYNASGSIKETSYIGGTSYFKTSWLYVTKSVKIDGNAIVAASTVRHVSVNDWCSGDGSYTCSDYPYYRSSSNNSFRKCVVSTVQASGNNWEFSCYDLTPVFTRGTYISDVTSTDENAYPADGVHTDGYWYIKQS